MTKSAFGRLPRRRSDEEFRAAVAADPDVAPVYTAEQARLLRAAVIAEDPALVASVAARVA